MTKVLVAAMALSAFAVAPSYGLVSAFLTVDDNVLLPGQSTIVHLFVSAQGEPENGGIYSVGVSIPADVPNVIVCTLPAVSPPPGDWVPPFNVGGLTPLPGSLDPNGGIVGILATPPVFPPMCNVGLDGPVEAVHFRVTAIDRPLVPLPATVNLSVQNFTAGGYPPGIVTWGKVIGNPTNYHGIAITVVPEPGSVTLLAAGVIAVRRRR